MAFVVGNQALIHDIFYNGPGVDEWYVEYRLDDPPNIYPNPYIPFVLSGPSVSGQLSINLNGYAPTGTSIQIEGPAGVLFSGNEIGFWNFSTSIQLVTNDAFSITMSVGPSPIEMPSMYGELLYTEGGGPPPASQLHLTVNTEPNAVSSGAVLNPQPVIGIADQFGVPQTAYNTNVQATLVQISGSAVLSGTTTVSTINGIATFTNLVITGNGLFYLHFASTILSIDPVDSVNLFFPPDPGNPDPAIPVKPKRSYIQGSVPTSLDMEINELAINVADRKGYMRDSNDVIHLLWDGYATGGGGGGGGGTVFSVGIASSDLSVSGSPITESGVISLSLVTQAVTEGIYGNSTNAVVVNVNSKGIITEINSEAIAFPVTSLIAGTAISLAGTTDITITNTAPDQTVTITAGTAIDVTGTYPNFTVSMDTSGLNTAIDSYMKGGELDYILLDTTPEITVSTPGTLKWNTTEQTLDIHLQNGVTLQTGQEEHIYARNSTGVTIPDGTLVMYAGSLGASGRILIAPFIADGSVESALLIGLTTQEILNGEDGYVTVFGKVRSIDTSAWAEGDQLFADAVTPGALTNVVPEAPAAKALIGYVINSHAVNGNIFIKIVPGSTLKRNEYAELTFPITDKSTLVYNETNDRFENAILDNTGLSSGSGTTGQVLVAQTGSGPIWENQGVFSSGRLTLTSGVPITTSDVTAAGTLYFTPYMGNKISVYSGASGFWKTFTFSEISLSLAGLISGKNYDVFIYDNAGNLELQLSTWTDDTTRSTALTTQDGVYVLTGLTEYRYVGTFRTTSTSTSEDSVTKRFLWNLNNRVNRPMYKLDATASWTYGTAAWRYARNQSSNRLDFVQGVSEDSVTTHVIGSMLNSVSASHYTGVGLDSSSTVVGVTVNKNNPTYVGMAGGVYTNMPSAGFHFLAWLEYTASGTATIYGGVQSGIFATIRG